MVSSTNHILIPLSSRKSLNKLILEEYLAVISNPRRAELLLRSQGELKAEQQPSFVELQLTKMQSRKFSSIWWLRDAQ